MNENLNLVEILKDCKPGIKLYSPLFGEVIYRNISEKHIFPINMDYYDNDGKVFVASFCKDGRYLNLGNGECMLFPSKDQRDWNKFKVNKPKFDPNTLKPFDNVLVIDSNRNWTPVLFSYLDFSLNYPRMLCFDRCSRIVIPYNEDTKHLVGTSYKVPEYYRYWEE